jgi:hypothetical protein
MNYSNDVGSRPPFHPEKMPHYGKMSILGMTTFWRKTLEIYRTGKRKSVLPTFKSRSSH